MVTIREVAKECGLSATTVSMVLNEAPLAQFIPEATKQRVIEIAKGMGYQPNPFAQALRSRHSHTVGVMVPDIADPYCAQILGGIEKSFSRSDYLPFLVDIQNDSLRFKKYLNVLLGRRVEGLIILANSLSFESEPLSALEAQKIPSVILGVSPEVRSDSGCHRQRSGRPASYGTPLPARPPQDRLCARTGDDHRQPSPVGRNPRVRRHSGPRSGSPAGGHPERSVLQL